MGPTGLALPGGPSGVVDTQEPSRCRERPRVPPVAAVPRGAHNISSILRRILRSNGTPVTLTGAADPAGDQPRNKQPQRPSRDGSRGSGAPRNSQGRWRAQESLPGAVVHLGSPLIASSAQGPFRGNKSLRDHHRDPPRKAAPQGHSRASTPPETFRGRWVPQNHFRNFYRPCIPRGHPGVVDTPGTLLGAAPPGCPQWRPVPQGALLNMYPQAFSGQWDPSDLTGAAQFHGDQPRGSTRPQDHPETVQGRWRARNSQGRGGRAQESLQGGGAPGVPLIGRVVLPGTIPGNRASRDHHRDCLPGGGTSKDTPRGIRTTRGLSGTPSYPRGHPGVVDTPRNPHRCRDAPRVPPVAAVPRGLSQHPQLTASLQAHSQERGTPETEPLQGPSQKPSREGTSKDTPGASTPPETPGMLVPPETF
ncbi:collagen alpha-1(V) chain-like [Homarus americanus]|uniref:collagen alpha-1(V) chain-like n=1 Tax=Homarus americanus TaxID=6706 RepID=UPI001C4413A4|nr:collagen alpha-1(V) chain-like [Homarus americanus]